MKIYVNEVHYIMGLRERPEWDVDKNLKEVEVPDDFLSQWCDTVKLGYAYEEGVDDNGLDFVAVYPYKDFGMLESIQREHEENQTIFSAATFMAVGFTDEQALKVPSLYSRWEEIPEGEKLNEGDRVRYGGDVLYKVIKTHDKQSSWNPKDSATLFTPIAKDDQGTVDNPIPWVHGMVSEKGKFYIDKGVIYECIEDSGIGLYGDCAVLARYFKRYEA